MLQGPISLGTLILANLLLVGLLGMGLLGAVIQGVSYESRGEVIKGTKNTENKKRNPKTLFFTFSYTSYLQN